MAVRDSLVLAGLLRSMGFTRMKRAGDGDEGDGRARRGEVNPDYATQIPTSPHTNTEASCSSVNFQTVITTPGRPTSSRFPHTR